MSSKQSLVEICQRMLWLDKEMERNYSDYKSFLSDPELIKIFELLQADEARHVNMEQRILTILQK